MRTQERTHTMAPGELWKRSGEVVSKLYGSSSALVTLTHEARSITTLTAVGKGLTRGNDSSGYYSGVDDGFAASTTVRDRN